VALVTVLSEESEEESEEVEREEDEHEEDDGRDRWAELEPR